MHAVYRVLRRFWIPILLVSGAIPLAGAAEVDEA